MQLRNARFLSDRCQRCEDADNEYGFTTVSHRERHGDGANALGQQGHHGSYCIGMVTWQRRGRVAVDQRGNKSALRHVSGTGACGQGYGMRRRQAQR